MRKTAEKINTACVIGAYTGIVGIMVGAGLMGLGSVSDNGQRGELREQIRNIAVDFEAHGVVNGNEVMDNPVSSFPINENNVSDDVTIKVTGNLKEGYCIIGTDSSIREDQYQTLEYSSLNNSSDQFGSDACDLDITKASVVVEGTPEEGGAQWDDFAWYTTLGAVGLFTVSAGTGFTVASREEKYERNVARKLVSSSEPPKEPQALEASPNANGEFSDLMVKVSNIKSEWTSYELDLMKILDYPSVTDMSVRSTSEFHKAMKHVNYLSELERVQSGASISDFRKAVVELDHKFDVMINDAKRKKWKGYSKQEQDSLRTAQNLLSIATNSASSENERQIAYKRLIKEVEGILVFPEKAVLELESSLALEITANISIHEKTKV